MTHRLSIVLALCAVTGLGAASWRNAVTDQVPSEIAIAAKPITTGADQLQAYLPYLKGKRIGMLVNQTSIIGNTPLPDSLHALGVKIQTIFGPEHGFRGNASNGAHVSDEVDPKTGIPVVSLYGKQRKPSTEQMAKIDLMIFDLQDVGCRFYTTINSLRDVMEACADNNKELLILDRPNPNGYVDGAVMDMKYKSGIGQFPIPFTHGMTIAEFAKMINGEGWLPGKKQCKLKIIPVKNYAHNMDYTLPVFPSPNLNSQQSVVLYPSICMFEGTIISQGRGTQVPFTVLGAPALKGKYTFNFTPVSIPGKSETPLHQNEVCYGLDLGHYNIDSFRRAGKINIRWMMEMYKAYPQKEKFFDRSYSTQIGNIYFLTGVTEFKDQIIAGASEEEIRKSWEPALGNYKKMRLKYLLYP
ncbi:MAG: DUF1343 domain-containing protein [Chitinophagaceae bacterium]|nr:DUF1343 domain-containing protein [Chitinophagaceae bacterium]